MQKNIILAGVGGQGILSIAYVIDNAALSAGYNFKQAEVHGMAQRGGAVQSHLRYSDGEIYSDLIPTGRADLVVSVEPLEVLRYWHYLQSGGWVVSSVTPYVNIPNYPEIDALMTELTSFENLVLVDSAKLAKAAGNLRSQNMVVVGAASILLDFSADQLLEHVQGLFTRKGEKIVAVNRKAFDLGRSSARFFRGLVDSGLAPLSALKLCQGMEPESVEPERAGAWAEALGHDDERLDALLDGDAPLTCDRVPV